MIAEITYNVNQYIVEVGYGGSSLYAEVGYQTTTYYVEVLQGGGGSGGISPAVWGGISGTLSAQTDLQAALDSKQAAGSYAASSHTHTKAQITDFAHSHPISEVTGLQAALDGKQASGSYATTSQVNAKQDLITGTDGQVVIKSGSTAGVVTTGTLAYPDATWDNVTGKPTTFAPAPHSHPISDITGLQAAIDGKQATLVSGTNIKTINNISLLGSGNIDVTGGGGGPTAWGAITGTLADQTDLQAALNAKQAAGSYAAASHTHAISDVTGLQTALDGKQASGSYASASHTHVIGDTTGLQTALDGKAASTHSHAIGDVTGLQTALDGKQAAGSYAAASHTHAISDVTSLQTSLDGKQANITGTDGQIVIKSGSTAGVVTTGTLAYPDADWSNITNKPATFTPSAHTHVKADITDFAHTHPQSDITNLTTDLAGKQATLVSGTNIKTINGASVLGAGDLTVSGSAAWGSVTGTLSSQTDLQSALDAKQATIVSGTHVKTLSGNSIVGSGDLNVLTVLDEEERADGYRYFNDFINSVTTSSAGGDVQATNTGTGAATSAQATDANNRIGLVRSTTGTTATGRTAVASAGSVVRLGGGAWVYETSVNVTTLSTGTERFQLAIGFIDTLTAANQVDGAYFLYDEGGVSTGSTAAAYWQTVTTANSVRTFNTSLSQTTVNAATWYKLRIEVNAAANSIGFYVNGSLVATHTANIPTAAGRETGFGWLLIKSVGTTARTVDFDYISVKNIFTTPR